MKYIKLFIISIFVFGAMLFAISLLFPSNTIVSRAVNMGGNKLNYQSKLPLIYETAFADANSFATIQKKINFMLSGKDSSAGEFVSAAYKVSHKDTLLMPSSFNPHIQQGAAVYQTAADSTVIQVFYKIHVPTYKFWDKFGLMLNEAKYGPSLDSAVSRIKKQYQ